MSEQGGDAVIGVLARDRLSAALTVIHRQGQGHHARVIDPARGDLPGQLRRAGVSDPVTVDPKAKDRVLILLHAPGRVAKGIELLTLAGATAVQAVARAGATVPLDGLTMPAPPSRRTPPRPMPPAPAVQLSDD